MTTPHQRFHGIRRFSSLFSRFVRDLATTTLRQMVVALVLAVGLALSDGMTAVLLLPLLAATGIDVGQGGISKLSELVGRVFAFFNLQQTLATSLAVYVAATAVRSVLARWKSVAGARAGLAFVVALRKRVFASIAAANWLSLSKARGADLGHVLTQELERVGSATYEVHNFVLNFIITVVYVILAARVSTGMTLAVTISGAILFVLLGPMTFRTQTDGAQLSRLNNRLYTIVIEHLSGLKTAKSYGAESQHVESLNAVSEEIAAAEGRAAKVYAASQLWFDIGSVAALAVLVYVGMRRFALTPAAVLLLVYLFGRLMPRVVSLQRGLQYLSHLLPSYERVADLRDRFEREREHPAPAGVSIPLRYRIRLERVRFRYDPDGPAAVDDVTLDIPCGSLTAIVGLSGAGKSTIADLLTGLQRPQEGRILVDDQVLDDQHVAGWKREIGYVAQDTFIFHDTVRANLLWANPAASESDMQHALEIADAQFILDFPDGLETTLGDRGLRLSGGERQRLALARALLRHPRLLILDEATSALDLENERRVLDTIERLKGRVTIVMITHRLSAIRRADVIHVMENGRLVESGDWDALRALPLGRFRALSDLLDGDEAFDRRLGAAIT